MRRYNVVALLGLVVWSLGILISIGLEAHACPTFCFDSTYGVNVWDYTTPNWYEPPSGPYNQTWSDGYGASFGGTAATVNVVDTISSVSDIEFSANGYTLTGGTINLTGLEASITTRYAHGRIDSVLSGSVGLTKSGSGVLVLGGANTFSGTTWVREGILQLDNPNALQNSILCPPTRTSGTLSFGTLTTATLAGLSGMSDLNLINDLGEPVALSIGNNDTSSTLSCDLNGGRWLEKVGTGTLTLSSSCSVGAVMVMRAGTVKLESLDTLQSSILVPMGGSLSTPSDGLLTVYALTGSGDLHLGGGTLNIQNNSCISTYSGILSGAVELHHFGGLLTLGSANTFTGNSYGNICLKHTNALQNSTYMVGGSLSFDTITSATLGGLGGGGELNLTNLIGQPVALSVGNNNQSTVFGGDLTGDGSLVKIGSGTLTLNSYNDTFRGDTVLREGTLVLGDYGALKKSTLNLQGGELLIPSHYAELGGIKGCANFRLDGDCLVVGDNDQSTVYSGVLSGDFEFIKDGSGTLTLSGANTFTGRTINGLRYLSILRLDNVHALQFSTFQGRGLSFGTLTTTVLGGLDGKCHIANTNDDGNAVAIFIGNNNESTICSGTLTGLGSLNKIGLGTLTLTALTSYVGLTTVEAGMLELDVLAQSPVFSGAGADVQGGTLTLDYVVGSASLAPTVREALSSGQIFCSTADGNGTLGWIEDTALGKVSIMYTLAGDANLDHSVNGTDLNAVLSNYNASDMGWTEGDFNYDGSVNGTDLNAVLSNYNQSLPASTAAVPEPSTWLLMVLGFMFWAVAIFRRSSGRRLISD